MVREAKGDKDRETILPESIKNDLSKHLASVRQLYDRDRKDNIEGVFLPGALAKKYPKAPKEWIWY